MTNINKEGYKPSYQKSYIQLESIADKAEAARIANGTVKEHQPKAGHGRGGRAYGQV